MDAQKTSVIGLLTGGQRKKPKPNILDPSSSRVHICWARGF